MKTLIGAMVAAGLLAGCISSSNPNPTPPATAVPPAPGTSVTCDSGNPPPCD